MIFTIIKIALILLGFYRLKTSCLISSSSSCSLAPSIVLSKILISKNTLNYFILNNKYFLFEFWQIFLQGWAEGLHMYLICIVHDIKRKQWTGSRSYQVSQSHPVYDSQIQYITLTYNISHPFEVQQEQGISCNFNIKHLYQKRKKLCNVCNFCS